MNVEEYGGSYRRLFMEKTFQDKIENFVPNQSDYEEVDALIELVKHDIIRARFDQLLPPVPQVKLDISKGRVYTLIFFSFRVVLGIFILLFIKTVSLAGGSMAQVSHRAGMPARAASGEGSILGMVDFFLENIF